MMKARTTLPRAPLNSASGRSRSASSLTSPAVDIFSVPERMIFDENPTLFSSSQSISASRYRPSPFRARSDSHSSSSMSTVSSSSSISTTCNSPTSQRHIPQHATKARAMSTLTHAHSSSGYGPRSDLISTTFIGPARPRHPPIVTTRHNSSFSVSGMSSPGDPGELSMPLDAFPGVDLLGENYVAPKPLPDPVIFDGPAKPRRQVPPATRKSRSNIDKTGVVAGLVGLGLGGAYEMYGTQNSSQKSASTSTSQEELIGHEVQNSSIFYLEDEESDTEDPIKDAINHINF